MEGARGPESNGTELGWGQARYLLPTQEEAIEATPFLGPSDSSLLAQLPGPSVSLLLRVPEGS